MQARRAKGPVVLATLMGALVASAHAMAEPPQLAVPLPESCATKTDALGLSRIVEIDTTDGPRFGHSQYKDVDFLVDGEVVLTFDDGPAHKYTAAVLDALDAQCTRATFFPVGRMALADPETLREVAKRGHTIGVHSWSHKNFKSLSSGKAKEEFELGLSAVSHVLGRPAAPFFRYPYLSDTKASLAYLGTRQTGVFSIEVDSRDFATRNPGAVVRTVMAQLKTVRKGIILFHDLQPSTASAMPNLLATLQADGFKVVHLTSKQSATTLPEYDALITKEIKRREGVVAIVAPAKASGDAAAGVAADSKNSTAPTATPASVTTAKPPPRAKRPFWQPSDDDWQIRTYIGDGDTSRDAGR